MMGLARRGVAKGVFGSTKSPNPVSAFFLGFYRWLGGCVRLGFRGLVLARLLEPGHWVSRLG